MIPKLEEYKRKWQVESANDIKPGLAAMNLTLDKLNHPEKNLPFIHVSGTNGKGSTIQYMEALLTAHGYRVGTFTSPARQDLHDQIQLNGENVSSAQIDQAFLRLKHANLSNYLTDFELLTTIAFLIFEKSDVDYILIETGMGGALDSTNVIEPLASIITSIAIEHTQFLGDTIEEIAGHKAGIIKKNRPIIVGSVCERARKIIEEKASQENSTAYFYAKDFRVEEKNTNEFFVGKKTFLLGERKMKGGHQKINLAIAIEALLHIGITLKENIIQEVGAQVQLAHRFEEIQPHVFLDGAHNPAAAAALRQTIEEAFPEEKVDFFIGMLKTKDIKNTLAQLAPVANSFNFIAFNHPDAATGEQLMENSPHKHNSLISADDILDEIQARKGRVIVVAGSLYLILSLKSF